MLSQFGFRVWLSHVASRQMAAEHGSLCVRPWPDMSHMTMCTMSMLMCQAGTSWEGHGLPLECKCTISKHSALQRTCN